jgi:hypothetical protein
MNENVSYLQSREDFKHDIKHIRKSITDELVEALKNDCVQYYLKQFEKHQINSSKSFKIDNYSVIIRGLHLEYVILDHNDDVFITFEELDVPQMSIEYLTVEELYQLFDYVVWIS